MMAVRSLWVAAAVLAGQSYVSAGELKFHADQLPRAMTSNGKVHNVIEASGVQPIGDGARALVAHDKSPELFILDLATGRLLGDPITSPHFAAKSKSGPKWEGMARDREGNMYIIGAHSGKTDEERNEKAVLMRFRLKPSDPPAIDDASIVRWEIGRALPSSLAAAGVDEKGIAKRKIEGLAIREINGSRDLVIGLREPSDKVRAVVADISREPSPGAELELKPLFAFSAEPREGVRAQLTALEYSPLLGGFLLVTATEDDDNAFHGNTLYFVADGETSKATAIATFEVAMKLEGLTILSEKSEGGRKVLKLLVTYDNDPHATKIPSRFQTATLIAD